MRTLVIGADTAGQAAALDSFFYTSVKFGAEFFHTDAAPT